jgi:hypothetical protein
MNINLISSNPEASLVVTRHAYSKPRTGSDEIFNSEELFYYFLPALSHDEKGGVAVNLGLPLTLCCRRVMNLHWHYLVAATQSRMDRHNFPLP